MRFSIFTACLITCLTTSPLVSQTVKDRAGAIHSDRAKMEQNERWIYNDVAAGFREAKRTGKPMMVVLRCVPCLSCTGIDTEVLVENDTLKPLMDQFVRVRVINANALDMSLFQFDYDLSFSTLFFNADGTVYGRYGSWAHQEDSQNRATETFRNALAGALELHAAYPSNKAALAGKQPKPSQYKTPIQMPTLQGKYKLNLDWDGRVDKSCVHCHMIGDAIRLSYRDHGGAIPQEWIYPFPDPGSLGMEFSEEGLNTITAMAKSTPASHAGLRPGDRIVTLNGQPLISTADFSWVLHHTTNEAKIEATIERDGAMETLTIPLPKGWRSGADISHRVGTWPMRAMAFGGMKLRDLNAAERSERGLGNQGMALLAENVGQYNKHGAAKRQGFMKGDLIVQIAGSTRRVNESEMIGALITKYKPGAKVSTKVMRNGKVLTLNIPVQ